MPMYWVVPQLRTVAQTRSLVAVGAATWYSLEVLQLRMAVHWRLDVSVGGADWYWGRRSGSSVRTLVALTVVV